MCYNCKIYRQDIAIFFSTVSMRWFVVFVVCNAIDSYSKEVSIRMRRNVYIYIGNAIKVIKVSTHLATVKSNKKRWKYIRKIMWRGDVERHLAIKSNCVRIANGCWAMRKRKRKCEWHGIHTSCRPFQVVCMCVACKQQDYLGVGVLVCVSVR